MQLEMPQFGPLGQRTAYVATYSPQLLFPVPRSMARDRIGMEGMPFGGEDIWTGFELGWLNSRGKPGIGLAEFRFPCTSPYLVESKSFKLYLNSFNQSRFDNLEQVRATLERDLSATIGAAASVTLVCGRKAACTTSDLPGISLDELDLETQIYEPAPHLLATEEGEAEETLHSHLLKSNCLATAQPDWGSLLISYQGPRLNREALLKYIISYRNHSGFAEHCVEQIFWDLWSRCRPKKLTVYARYTRRGGLDINPFRSNFEPAPSNVRLVRQ
jgi:7-cyano-7-deazaguanine reductase